MKVLVTGYSGFVGTNLYKSFYNDFELFGLDITNKGVFPTESIYNWEQLDKIPKILPVNTIIHLTDKAHDTKNSMTPSMQKRSKLHVVGGFNETQLSEAAGALKAVSRINPDHSGINPELQVPSCKSRKRSDSGSEAIRDPKHLRHNPILTQH